MPWIVNSVACRHVDGACSQFAGHGGSMSGEHGDGRARGELLTKMYGESVVGAFREFKAIFDPDGRMNPGKVVDPYPLDTHLRTGTDRHDRLTERDDHHQLAALGQVRTPSFCKACIIRSRSWCTCVMYQFR